MTLFVAHSISALVLRFVAALMKLMKLRVQNRQAGQTFRNAPLCFIVGDDGRSDFFVANMCTSSRMTKLV